MVAKRKTPLLLNLDGGELDDEPEELYALADTVHVACGGHAGDDASMARVVDACVRLHTRIGAHPSYEDREGFGRRPRAIEPGPLAESIATQCARLAAIAEPAAGRRPIASVKPHGALYHAADASEAAARACVDGVLRALGRVPIVGPGGGWLARICAEAGVPFLREKFADRGVRPDGSLVPRGEPGALVEDPVVAAARASELAAAADVDTLCIYADTQGALAIGRAVRDALGPRVPLDRRARA